MMCCSPPVAPISTPSVLSYHHCSSQPPHLSEGPPHSLSNTMARCLDNCRLPVFVGSAGRQLYSTPPSPPPPSHSTKAGISLSLHPLHTAAALYHIKPLITGSTRLRCCCWWLNLLAKTVFQPRESAQREHRFKCSILPFDVYKSYILVNPFSVYMCAFCVYLIILTVSPWHHIVKPEWRYNLLITVLMWQVLLFFFFVVVFFLHVLTSEGGSVCLGVAILCTVMCFWGS